MVKKVADKNAEVIIELTGDLQRLRADFENYRKSAEAQKQQARLNGREEMIQALLPVIDNIERATAHAPAELADNEWARGVLGLNKSLELELTNLGVTKVNAQPGTIFNPDQHDAVQFDENAEGDVEVIESELQTGYLLNGAVLRPAMVRVTRK